MFEMITAKVLILLSTEIFYRVVGRYFPQPSLSTEFYLNFAGELTPNGKL